MVILAMISLWLFPSSGFTSIFVIFLLAVSIKNFPQFLHGILSVLALQSILQTMWYYLGGRQNTMTDIIIAGIISIATLFFYTKQLKSNKGLSFRTESDEVRNLHLFQIDVKRSLRELVEKKEAVRRPFRIFVSSRQHILLAFIMRHTSALLQRNIRTPWPPSKEPFCLVALFLSQWLPLTSRHHGSKNTCESRFFLSRSSPRSCTLGFDLTGSFIKPANMLLEGTLTHIRPITSDNTFSSGKHEISLSLATVDTFSFLFFAGLLPWLFIPSSRSHAGISSVSRS